MPSAIRRAGFDARRAADVNPPATVLRMLQDDVDFARVIIGAYRDTESDEAPLLGEALAGEFDAVREAIYAGLRLTGHPC